MGYTFCFFFDSIKNMKKFLFIFLIFNSGATVYNLNTYVDSNRAFRFHIQSVGNFGITKKDDVLKIYDVHYAEKSVLIETGDKIDLAGLSGVSMIECDNNVYSSICSFLYNGENNIDSIEKLQGLFGGQKTNTDGAGASASTSTSDTDGAVPGGASETGNTAPDGPGAPAQSDTDTDAPGTAPGTAPDGPGAPGGAPTQSAAPVNPPETPTEKPVPGGAPKSNNAVSTEKLPLTTASTAAENNLTISQLLRNFDSVIKFCRGVDSFSSLVTQYDGLNHMNEQDIINMQKSIIDKLKQHLLKIADSASSVFLSNLKDETSILEKCDTHTNTVQSVINVLDNHEYFTKNLREPLACLIEHCKDNQVLVNLTDYNDLPRNCCLHNFINNLENIDNQYDIRKKFDELNTAYKFIIVALISHYSKIVNELNSEHLNSMIELINRKAEKSDLASKRDLIATINTLASEIKTLRTAQPAQTTAQTTAKKTDQPANRFSTEQKTETNGRNHTRPTPETKNEGVFKRMLSATWRGITFPFRLVFSGFKKVWNFFFGKK